MPKVVTRQTPRAEINQAKIAQVRSLLSTGINQKEAAKKAGVDPSVVSNIVRGKYDKKDIDFDKCPITGF